MRLDRRRFLKMSGGTAAAVMAAGKVTGGRTARAAQLDAPPFCLGARRASLNAALSSCQLTRLSQKVTSNTMATVAIRTRSSPVMVLVLAPAAPQLVAVLRSCAWTPAVRGPRRVAARASWRRSGRRNILDRKDRSGRT